MARPSVNPSLKDQVNSALGAPDAPEPQGSDRAKKVKKSKGTKRLPSARRLFEFDRKFNVRFVAGADEAGRGSLAGPLVAAAVLFDYDQIDSKAIRTLAGLNDSKQQDPDLRKALYPLILKIASRITIASRCASRIDNRGLHITNLAALHDVLRRVGCQGCLCLSDGFAVADTGYDQRPIVGGDGKSAAIAAASVIAKVTRDRFMKKIAEKYPGWEFESHVGYSTPNHRAAIARLGITPLHRRSFASVAYQQLELELA